MKKTIAILLVAIMAVGSVFAAVTGEASLGAGLNFDNGNYGFIDSGAKVKIDVDLATADAEAIAEGDVYASVKASFGLKVYSGEKNISEIEDPSFAGDKWKVGLTADITEAMIAGANWSVSILGLDGAPNYAKGFQTYTVKKGIDKWGFERNDFDEQYSIDSNFDKATGIQATVYGYKVGFGLVGDYDSADTWKFAVKLNVAALFETPEYNFNGLTLQAGAAYSYHSMNDEKVSEAKDHNLNMSVKAGYANDVLSASVASDMVLGIPTADGEKATFDAEVAANFIYDFLTVDAYYGTNPVTGKTPKAPATDSANWGSYNKSYSEHMLSAQVKTDLNSFDVPVAITVGVNDIIAKQAIKAKVEVTPVAGLSLAVNGGYTIDDTGRAADGAILENNELVGKWSAGLDATYEMDIMKITAGVSAEQKIVDGDKVKLGMNAAVETSSLIPGATLKLAWADADDLTNTGTEDTQYGKVTASIKMTF